MQTSKLIAILTDSLNLNGDMEIVGMVDGVVFPYIEINATDQDSPLYLELYK